jgi:hypothetical protein
MAEDVGEAEAGEEAVAEDGEEGLLDRELLLAVAVGGAGRVVLAQGSGPGVRVDLAGAEGEEGQAAAGR